MTRQAFLTLTALSFLVLATLTSSCRTASSRFVLKDKMEAWPGGTLAELDPLASATWKECLPETYLFLERVGSPTRTGDVMRQLFGTVQSSGVDVIGAPFSLFYGDSDLPSGQMRVRVCVPVEPGTRPTGDLRVDRLPTRMVVFKQQRGSYAQAHEAMPSILEYMQARNWEQNGPVREIYLVNPGEVANVDQLVAEVQVPWGASTSGS